MEQEHAIRYLSDKDRARYLTLKEAAALTDYTPDYIGQLIRAGKIEGFQVYTNVSWVTTEAAIRSYLASKGKQDRAAADEHPWYRNPHFYFESALYLMIVCLVCLLLFLLYVFAVTADKALNDASLKEFDTRPYEEK